MDTPDKQIIKKEAFPKPENVSCFKLKEYLVKRNMHFEEKKTVKTTTIIIKRQHSQL